MADFTKANREAFDRMAANYDAEPWQLKLASTLAENLQKNKDWLGARWSQSGETRKVALLDYACGTGSASIALRPFVTHTVGLDLSEQMITRYNETMLKLGCTQEQAHGVVADLTDPTYDELSETREQYDVAIISLALHHVNDPELLLKAIVKRLRPGTGVLIVVDFLPFKHSHTDDKHKMEHTINQHGFTQEQMAELYHTVGLDNFGLIVVPEKISMSDNKHGSADGKTMFIARGTVTK